MLRRWSTLRESVSVETVYLTTPNEDDTRNEAEWSQHWRPHNPSPPRRGPAKVLFGENRVPDHPTRLSGYNVADLRTNPPSWLCGGASPWRTWFLNTSTRGRSRLNKPDLRTRPAC